jgi:short-subunit dehydrogenase
MRNNILITGASSGLGRGMAREFAALGRNLALCARRLDRLQELKKELENAYPGIHVAIAELDVTQSDQVFEVFREFREALGTLDRVIVNAGMGKGASIGTGYFHANRQTAETNFLAALAQCEAAVEIFREQNAGHLVMMSSMSAFRGMPRALTVYAATKAGVAVLAEGIRADLMRTPIKVTTLFPGFIRSEINEKMKNTPFIVDTESGCKALVDVIEKERASACVPAWPWREVSVFMKLAPLKWVSKMG